MRRAKRTTLEESTGIRGPVQSDVVPMRRGKASNHVRLWNSVRCIELCSRIERCLIECKSLGRFVTWLLTHLGDRAADPDRMIAAMILGQRDETRGQEVMFRVRATVISSPPAAIHAAPAGMIRAAPAVFHAVTVGTIPDAEVVVGNRVRGRRFPLTRSSRPQ